MENEEKNIDVWERKDRKMGWMNCLKSASELLSALIEAGAYKPKNTEKAFDELLVQQQRLYNEFLDTVTDNLTFKTETVDKPKPKCVSCSKEITEAEFDYSNKWFGKSMCYKCQPRQPKPEGQ